MQQVDLSHSESNDYGMDLPRVIVKVAANHGKPAVSPPACGRAFHAKHAFSVVSEVLKVPGANLARKPFCQFRLSHS
jgi:hypothetical protein